MKKSFTILGYQYRREVIEGLAVIIATILSASFLVGVISFRNKLDGLSKRLEQVRNQVTDYRKINRSERVSNFKAQIELTTLISAKNKVVRFDSVEIVGTYVKDQIKLLDTGIDVEFDQLTSDTMTLNCSNMGYLFIKPHFKKLPDIWGSRDLPFDIQDRKIVVNATIKDFQSKPLINIANNHIYFYPDAISQNHLIVSHNLIVVVDRAGFIVFFMSLGSNNTLTYQGYVIDPFTKRLYAFSPFHAKHLPLSVGDLYSILMLHDVHLEFSNFEDFARIVHRREYKWDEPTATQKAF